MCRPINYVCVMVGTGRRVLAGTSSYDAKPAVFPQPDEVRRTEAENLPLGTGFGPRLC